ncbi:MAG: TetR/AcrR family transcriptional regulator [Flavobacteriales bacterium]|nr:TetR/AcrR family transcriptional regulator [Flavobacteriales bacterium]
MTQKDQQTATKIKEVAKSLFKKKGFKETTTREIASEAGTNLALVNYYFGTKEKLFKSVMLETMDEFFGQIKGVMNSEHPFEEKVDLLVGNYIDLLTDQPELPVFLLSELRQAPENILARIDMPKGIGSSTFFQELKQRSPEGVHPIHMLLNLLSLTVFPFAAKPMVQAMTSTDDKAYYVLMEQRRSLIKLWFMNILSPPQS